jgi:integrase
MARKAFTDRGIASLPIPKTGQADHYDARTPGLGIRISYGGSRTWFLKYLTPDNRQRRKKLGRYPEMSLADARTAALDFKHELVIEKIDPAERAKRERGEPTFGELTHDYMSWIKGKLDDDGKPISPRKRSWKEDERILTTAAYFAPFRNRKAVDIERIELVERLQEISRRNGGVMANRCLAAVRRVYNWGYKQGAIPPHNPAHMVEKPHREVSRDRVYSGDEMERLWEAFGQQGGAGQAFRLAMVTGQRINEVAGLKWSDIAEGPHGDDGKIWTLALTNYKTAKTHVVPLSPLALRVIEDTPRTNDTYVFASPRGLDQPVTMSGKLRAMARELSGVEDFEPHDFRRCLSTNAGPLGFEPHIADRLLGHVQDNVSNTYNRYQYHAEKRALAEAWARHVEGIIGESANVVQMEA